MQKMAGKDAHREGQNETKDTQPQHTQLCSCLSLPFLLLLHITFFLACKQNKLERMFFTFRDLLDLFPGLLQVIDGEPLLEATAKTFLCTTMGKEEVHEKSTVSVKDLLDEYLIQSTRGDINVPESILVVEPILFTFKANITHSFGKRLTTDSPVATDAVEKKYKFPRVVFDRMKRDEAFLHGVSVLVQYCNSPLMVEVLPFCNCVNCVTHRSSQFVMCVSLNVYDDSFVIQYDQCYPICKELVCRARMIAFQSKHVVSLGKDPHRAFVACEYCGSVGITNLKVCSRCKVMTYCSRQCQVAHWSEHKRECRKIRKKELRMSK
jgi:hypothetical protein